MAMGVVAIPSQNNKVGDNVAPQATQINLASFVLEQAVGRTRNGKQFTSSHEGKSLGRPQE